MKHVCKYAIVQFLPYAETGEYANVGVLVCAPKTGLLDFKMAPARFARVTTFFDDLDGEVYKAAIKTFGDELNQIKKTSTNMQGENLLDFVVEVTRYRESLLRFSNLRTIACNNPQDVIEKLYERYIARDFLTKEYREHAMVKAIRSQFNTRKLTVKYHQKKITSTSELREVTLPLVADVGNKIRVIKPMAFYQNKTNQIIEHGETWMNRFKWLINEDKVEARRILLPVEGPKMKGQLNKAFKEVINEIKTLDVNVIDFSEKERILNFAVEDLDAKGFDLH